MKAGPLLVLGFLRKGGCQTIVMNRNLKMLKMVQDKQRKLLVLHHRLMLGYRATWMKPVGSKTVMAQGLLRMTCSSLPLLDRYVKEALKEADWCNWQVHYWTHRTRATL